MSKRNHEEMVHEIAAEVVKRMKQFENEPDKNETSHATTLMTSEDDRRVRNFIFAKLASIISDGELFQTDTQAGVREYSFTVKYPNEFNNEDMSLLMLLPYAACVIISAGRVSRSFTVTIPCTKSKTTKNAIIKEYTPNIPDNPIYTGDKMFDLILQRIDSCVSRDKDKPEQVSKSEAEAVGSTTLSFPLKEKVPSGSVYGILALGIFSRLSFIASEVSTWPILKVIFVSEAS